MSISNPPTCLNLEASHRVHPDSCTIVQQIRHLSRRQTAGNGRKLNNPGKADCHALKSSGSTFRPHALGKALAATNLPLPSFGVLAAPTIMDQRFRSPKSSSKRQDLPRSAVRWGRLEDKLS